MQLTEEHHQAILHYWTAIAETEWQAEDYISDLLSEMTPEQIMRAAAKAYIHPEEDEE